MEEIGKIKLDYSKYPGQDFYCDGSVEDELLEIVKQYTKEEYARIIKERNSWPVLYHLSSQRENIVDWLPMDRSHKVLEVGSGCGAITGALARKAGSVTCVELSRKRSLINAYRHRECDNVTIHVGNFKDIEPELPRDFDYICLIGVFEYGQSYIGGDTPYEDFLKILMPHLGEKGRIVIAIENKLGLKYFAGCMEDHLGTYFSGIENYAEGGGVRTFSRSGLEKIFRNCGVEQAHFYYPYPDYKFMHTLFSDERLPGKGELSDNYRNFDRDRMLLFDEKKAFDGMIEDGLFPVFSNSYLAVLGAAPEVQYVKYSTERAPEYAIRTEIRMSPEGEKQVRKYPACKAAESHVRRMAKAYEALSEKYRGGAEGSQSGAEAGRCPEINHCLEINRCELAEKGNELYAAFEFVKGTPLSELMDDCLERNDTGKFYEYFREYLQRIGHNPDYPVSDYDLIFSNILVNGDRWTLIDYEWTCDRAIPVKELAYRAVYCYLLESSAREKLETERVLEELELTPEEAEGLKDKEREFQTGVTGELLSLAQMRELLGHPMIEPSEWLDRYYRAAAVNRVQIFTDKGEGYSEETSLMLPEAFRNDHLIELDLGVEGDVKMLRIDPAFSACMIRVVELSFNGQSLPLRSKEISVNGRIVKPDVVVFPTEDPNINISLEKLQRKKEDRLHAVIEIACLPVATAKVVAAAIKYLI